MGSDGSRITRELTISDLGHLADGNANGGGPHLRLTVAQSAHNGGGDDLGANNLAIVGLRGATARENDNLDRGALGSPVAIVQVVEVARLALVPDGRATQGEGAVLTRAEASGVDGTGLRGSIKLELEVAGNVTNAALSVGQDRARQAGDKNAIAGALSTLLLSTN